LLTNNSAKTVQVSTEQQQPNRAINCKWMMTNKKIYK